MSTSLPAQRPFLPTAAHALPDRSELAFLLLHIVTTALVVAAGLAAIALGLC